MRIDFAQPVLVAEQALRKYLDALSTNFSTAQDQLTGMGAVGELEAKLRKFYGCKHALTFSSATNALTAIAIVLELQQQEVLTTAFNYPTSIAGLQWMGSKLVLVENKADLTICPKALQKAITPKSKAVWAVDFGGNPHDMYRLRKICYEYQLYYIADAAQSFGATIQGLPASSLADIWVTSFTSGKTLYGGEGGAIMTNNTQLYQKLLQFIHPYRVKLEVGLQTINQAMPINGRINPLGAVIANSLFDYSLIALKEHQIQVLQLFELLEAIDGITPIIPYGESSFFYILAKAEDENLNTSDFSAFLQKNSCHFLTNWLLKDSYNMRKSDFLINSQLFEKQAKKQSINNEKNILIFTPSIPNV